MNIMHRSLLAVGLLVVVAVGVAACAGDDERARDGVAAGEQPQRVADARVAAEPMRVLIFSRTTGFRHQSIPDGIAAVRELGEAHGFEVSATEDPAAFDDGNLARYAAVVFMSTTGDVLDDAQKQAFERYIRGGGGFVGVHSAADTEYDWPWYGELVGAYFLSHPRIQSARVVVEDREHISTRHLPEAFEFTDEWYEFRRNPREHVNVLLTLDEQSYEPRNPMGEDHPIAWYREFDGGRTWYTGLGHRRETFADERFRLHLLGGIMYAARGAGAD